MYLLGKQNFGLLLFDRIQRLLVEVEPPAGPGFPAGPLAGPLTGPLAGHLAGPLAEPLAGPLAGPAQGLWAEWVEIDFGQKSHLALEMGNQEKVAIDHILEKYCNLLFNT